MHIYCVKYSWSQYLSVLFLLHTLDFLDIFEFNHFQLPVSALYEGHLESKERFAIKKYLLIMGKKKNMQVLSHTFTYFST